MPFFNGGGFTHSMVSDSQGGSQDDLWEELPSIIGGVTQSVTAIVGAIRGEPVAPIGVQVGVAPETQRGLAIGGGAILLLLALFFFFPRK